jgi:hypothetical protein
VTEDHAPLWAHFASCFCPPTPFRAEVRCCFTHFDTSGVVHPQQAVSRINGALSLALLYLMLLVLRSGFVQTLLGKHREPPVYDQPPQQPREAEARVDDFGLTPPEYDSSPAHPSLAESAYGQGYQAQTSWMPERGDPEAQPKQEYDQPQVYYPEMELPPQ